MADAQGVSTQTVTDGRLTLKQAHLQYLDLPEKDAKVDVSYGPENCILLHNPARRQQLLAELLDSQGLVLDSDENLVEIRLDSVANTVAVDDQGRMRIPELHLRFASLIEKSCKVVIVPRRRSGWLEVWGDANFDTFVKSGTDEWLDCLSRVSRRRLKERSGDAGS
jgi:DNA-binding transcriptional regulator/RsmH inhibitor MraZ